MSDDGVNRSPQEIQSLLAPTPKGLDGEWDETPSWQYPSWIPPMFAFSSPCSSSAVLVGSRMLPSAALRMSDHEQLQMIETRAQLSQVLLEAIRPRSLRSRQWQQHPVEDLRRRLLSRNLQQRITRPAGRRYRRGGISNEVSESTHTPSLEEACSIPLLEGYGEAYVPGIQQSNFSPVPPASPSAPFEYLSQASVFCLFAT